MLGWRPRGPLGQCVLRTRTAQTSSGCNLHSAWPIVRGDRAAVVAAPENPQEPREHTRSPARQQRTPADRASPPRQILGTVGRAWLGRNVLSLVTGTAPPPPGPRGASAGGSGHAEPQPAVGVLGWTLKTMWLLSGDHSHQPQRAGGDCHSLCLLGMKDTYHSWSLTPGAPGTEPKAVP